MADDQCASVREGGNCNEYRQVLGFGNQRCGSLDALLRGVCSRLDDHTSFADRVRGHLRQDLDLDVDVYLHAFFAAMRDRTASFCSATSNGVEMHCATLFHDVLFVLTNLDSRLAASFQDSGTKSFYPLDPGAVLPPL